MGGTIELRADDIDSPRDNNVFRVSSMSAHRVLDKLRNAQSGDSRRGDDDRERESGMGDGDVQSVEDVVCCDRGTPLVTTALGLMGYQVPQFCDVMMRHWMNTVHTLLRHDLLTAPKLRRILDDLDLVLSGLKGQPLLELIEALLNAAVHMKNMPPKSTSDSWTFVRTKRSGEISDAAWAIERILDRVVKEKEFLYSHFSPMARLQVWRLRPSLLKVDLSDLAKEAMRRRLLSLKVETGSCRTLGFMVASLALAPDLLNEARRLLLIWSSSVRAVRLLELRAQLTIAVHGILQYSNSTWSTLSGCDWLHTLHSSSLRPFLQILVGVPTASALGHLVELMERRESTARAAAIKKTEMHTQERSPKRQRRSYATVDQNESLDDSSSNVLDILGDDKATAGLRTKTNALFAIDGCKVILSATTAASLEVVDNYPVWTLLADFLPWSTFASQLLFQDIDVSTVNRQSAADFLGWLMCPSNPEGRAYATTEFLHAAEDWQSLWNEGITKQTQTFKSPGVARSLSDLENVKKTNFPRTVCNLCGSPLYWTGDLVNGIPHCVSNSQAFQNLVAWLLRFCSLQTQLQQANLKGCGSVSKHQSYGDGMWKVIRVFPISSLSSDANLLTPEVGGLLLSMIFLGLTSSSREPPAKETSLSPPSCCTACEDLHCASCCYKDRHKSSEPPHRTEQFKNDARIEEDFCWAPFAAALFTYLDTNILANSTESQSLQTPPSGPKVIVGRVVAACVHHWVQLTSQSHNVETVYHRRIQMLEDLLTRILAWADAAGVDAELAQAVGNLRRQIEHFKHF